MKNPGSPMYSLFLEQCNSNTNNVWAKKVKYLLDSLGLTYIWDSYNPQFNYFYIIRQRLRDQYLQE